MRSYLSGMPEVKLTLSNKLLSKKIGVENYRFHQCVRIARFENDQTLSCIPPDGEFEMMAYEYSDFAKPPVQIKNAVTSSLGQTEYQVCLKSLLTAVVIDLEI